MKTLWTVLAVLCGPAIAIAADINGLVVSVADGDTVTVLDAERKQHRVRLAGIDSPEKAQPFGQQAKASLSAMVFGRMVRVVGEKYDRHGRRVGKVMVNDQDINLAQVEAGMAWHYKAYAREQEEADRVTYAEAELRAKTALRGLWALHAVPPWEFRRPRRSESTHALDQGAHPMLESATPTWRTSP